jgi:hypothetical protein
MGIRRMKPIPKTQKEISKELQPTPYDTEQGNPNNAQYDPNNRGNQLSFRGDTTKPYNVGIQDIDESIMYYFENVIQPTVFQNGTTIPIPIIYGSPERMKSIQKDGYYRDKAGKIMAPLIMYKRDNIEKNYSIGNKLDANQPHNYAVAQKHYSKQNEYDNFNILNNRKPQKTYYAIIIPDYVTLTYQCSIYTYYVEQMNKIIESINYASDSYWGNPERFKFKARIDSYTTNVTLNQGEERVVKSDFTIKMYGYIIPEVINKQLNSIKKFNNKTKINFSVETVTDGKVFEQGASIPSFTSGSDNITQY